MTIPFDVTKPEARPEKITFFTDEDTGLWLDEMAKGHDLERSLVVHRIVKQARESASPTDGDKRTGEDRRKAS